MVGRYPAQDSKLKCLAPGGDTSALRPASHLILRPRADLASQEEGVPTPCAECGLAQCVATSGKGSNDAGHTGAVSKPALVRVSREPLPNSGSIARVDPTRIGCPWVGPSRRDLGDFFFPGCSKFCHDRPTRMERPRGLCHRLQQASTPHLSWR